jgi:hypothetical protein
MDDEFYESIDSNPDISISENVEPIQETLDSIDFSPIDDSFSDNVTELDVSAMQNEVDTLAIEPITDNIVTDQFDGPYFLDRIIGKVSGGLTNPTPVAEIVAEAIGGVTDVPVPAQLVQGGVDGGIEVANCFMEETINTHGPSPIVEGMNSKISQNIETGAIENNITPADVLADNEPIFDAAGNDLTDPNIVNVEGFVPVTGW